MPRFKKGSAAAKAWGAKMRRLRNSSKKPRSRKSSVTKLKRRSKPMAKRKATRRRSKSMGSFFGINVGSALSAAIYGASRQKLDSFVGPYAQRLPLGNVADEAGLIMALTLAKKFLFKGKSILRDAASAGQLIEFARIGDAVASGDVKLGNMSNGAGSSGNIF